MAKLVTPILSWMSTLKMLLVEDGDGGGGKEKQELRISWGAENNDKHWGNHWGRGVIKKDSNSA